MDEWGIPDKSTLLKSGKACLDQGQKLLEDAEVLSKDNRHSTSYALSILALEEYSKGFILLNSVDTRRWDETLFSGLRDHRPKQAVILTLLQWAEWFYSTNSFALRLNTNALIPAPITLMPPMQVLQEWVQKNEKDQIKKSKLDRAKQRALYVDVNKEGRISSFPSVGKDISEGQRTQTEKVKVLLDFYYDYLRGKAISPPQFGGHRTLDNP